MSNSDSGNTSIPPVVTDHTSEQRESGDLKPLVAFDAKPRRRTRPLTQTESWKDITIVSLMVAVSDLLIYRYPGFASTALVMAIFALVIVAWKWRRVLPAPTAVLFISLVLVVLRLLYSGTTASVVVGVFLLLCLSMTSSMRPAWIPEVLATVPYGLVGAFERLIRLRVLGLGSQHRRTVNGDKNSFSAENSDSSANATSALLPVSTVALFSTFFVLANPNLRERLSAWLWAGWDMFQSISLSIDRLEILFWFVAAIVSLSLLYPRRVPRIRESKVQPEKATAPGMAAYRNTLICVAVLFAAYLVFEFATLWFREFPEDFYYAGYAHAGAFWLTVALATATLLLSYMFRKSTLADDRVQQLKRLSWVWAVENFLLSLAVINRLTIYVRYNGLTQMRILGYLGIAAVIAGFLLVVYKVYRDKGFVWLVHRQLWCPVIAGAAFVTLPVAWLANRYNVWEIERGNLKPAVQLVAHRFDTTGMLPIVRLINHPNEQVRESALALLATWQFEQRTLASQNKREDQANDYQPWESELGHRSPWNVERNRPAKRSSDRRLRSATNGYRSQESSMESSLKMAASFQLAEVSLHQAVRLHASKLEPFRRSATRRARAIDELFRFTYRWY